MNGNELLIMARKDFRALCAMKDNTVDFADEIFGFHAQQSAEKALKSWLLSFGEPLVRTHDLSFLLSTLEKQGIDIFPWLELLELGTFGVQFRYEEIPFEEESLDRPRFILILQQLLETVERNTEKLV